MIERRTKRSLEDIIPENLKDIECDKMNCFRAIMTVAFCRFFQWQGIVQCSEVLSIPSRLLCDGMHKTDESDFIPAEADFSFNAGGAVQKTYKLVKTHMELGKRRQKTYYEFRTYRFTYRNVEEEERLALFTTVKIGDTKKLMALCRVR